MQWIAHYLDDFIVAGRPRADECARSLQVLLSTFEELGVPIVEHKVEGPSTYLPWDRDRHSGDGVASSKHEALDSPSDSTRVAAEASWLQARAGITFGLPGPCMPHGKAWSQVCPVHPAAHLRGMGPRPSHSSEHQFPCRLRVVGGLCVLMEWYFLNASAEGRQP